MLWQPHFYDKAPPLDYELDDDQIEPWSPDFRTELAKQLAEIAPEAVADGKIDVETLKELLEGDASDTSERFGLFWPGKKRAMRAAQTPTSATLAPDFENSKDWDTTKNVFIEGDNLEVLKILQKHYHGKIKMIYIDPPYNTGKDFVYPDNYREGLDNYLEWSKQVNEEGQKLSTNTDTGGRLHTNWLNMMYPRLKLARTLLTPDGVIAISINDAELSNLLHLTDELLGTGERIGIFVWKKRSTGGQVAKNAIINQTEYILLYSKDSSALNLRGPVNENAGSIKWRDFRKSGGQWQRRFRPGQFFPFWLSPDGSLSLEQFEGAAAIYPQDKNGEEGFWENGIETASQRLSAGEFRPKKSSQGWKIEQKEVAKEFSNAGNFIEIPSVRGVNELKALFDDVAVFDNPKPTELISHLMTIAGVSNGDTVLDFFAGSGTTAHAVIALNAQDGEQRNFIQVQLPEPTPEGSPAHRSGFTTIADLSRERIKRAASDLNGKQGKSLIETATPLDTGFRAYRLVDTNFTKWHLTADAPTNAVEQHILDIQDSAKDSATQDALLTELLLKQGMSLTERVNQFEVAGLNCHAVLNIDSEADAEDQYVLIAYVDEHTKPTLEQLRAIVELQPARLVILEDAFQGDDQLKTNLKQMCVTNDIELKTA